jgi:membrane-associated phospholipid phosphatase
MSSDDSDRPELDTCALAAPPETPAEAVQVLKQEGRFGVVFLRVHGMRLLLVFLGVLLPLLIFGVLGDDLREGKTFRFDLPILRLLHGLASADLNRISILASAVGYAWGVIPVDIGLLLGLSFWKRMREGLFAGVSIIGSMLLNIAAKHSFERARPGLWMSPSPAETTYSFPSGHAMGSMTLAMVVVLLCWNLRTRGGLALRWPVTSVAALFVLLVGLSRVYLGVHYPSDILAGWTAACAWVVGVYALVYNGTLKPWQPHPARRS